MDPFSQQYNDECDREIQMIMRPQISRNVCLCKKYGNPYIKKRCPVCGEINTPKDAHLLARRKNSTDGSGHKQKPISGPDYKKQSHVNHLPVKDNDNKRTAYDPNLARRYHSTHKPARKLIKPKVIPPHEFFELYYPQELLNTTCSNVAVPESLAKYTRTEEESLSRALKKMSVDKRNAL